MSEVLDVGKYWLCVNPVSTARTVSLRCLTGERERDSFDEDRCALFPLARLQRHLVIFPCNVVLLFATRGHNLLLNYACISMRSTSAQHLCFYTVFPLSEIKELLSNMTNYSVSLIMNLPGQLQCIHKVFTALLLFPTCFMLQPYSKMDWIHLRLNYKHNTP